MPAVPLKTLVRQWVEGEGVSLLLEALRISVGSKKPNNQVVRDWADLGRFGLPERGAANRSFTP